MSWIALLTSASWVRSHTDQLAQSDNSSDMRHRGLRFHRGILDRGISSPRYSFRWTMCPPGQRHTDPLMGQGRGYCGEGAPLEPGEGQMPIGAPCGHILRRVPGPARGRSPRRLGATLTAGINPEGPSMIVPVVLAQNLDTGRRSRYPQIYLDVDSAPHGRHILGCI
ncbi:hypothetical protein MMC07_009642 [Pseudocyphellaria aurata]|nr:hypothetical protein [Pseudocyphellaria aurata]